VEEGRVNMKAPKSERFENLSAEDVSIVTTSILPVKQKSEIK
tara:strand:+ start:233 stop:358 length:126 start_codon:yes stop_codon:yes gene_type:complete